MRILLFKPDEKLSYEVDAALFIASRKLFGSSDAVGPTMSSVKLSLKFPTL